MFFFYKNKVLFYNLNIVIHVDFEISDPGRVHGLLSWRNMETHAKVVFAAFSPSDMVTPLSSSPSPVSKLDTQED